MKRSTALLAGALLVCTALLVFKLAVPAASAPAEAPRAALTRMPLLFVPNVGQHTPEVQFEARGMGGTLWFSREQVQMALPGEGDSVVTAGLRFEAANAGQQINGSEQTAGLVNYFIGADPQAWHTNIPTFAGVDYQQLYAGIDLHFDGLEGTLKGTYTVAGGTDPAAIRWHYDGAAQVQADDSSGDLQIELAAGGQLIERKPTAWQTINGEQRPVEVAYAVADDGSVGFRLGEYDRTQTLVIDPTLVYSTYWGGAGTDSAYGVAADGNGSAVIVGSTTSANLTTGNPLQGTLSGTRDVFVSKLSPDGNTVIFSTYLGGVGTEEGRSIVLDANNTIYLSGETGSGDFPVVGGFQSGSNNTNAFLVKLAANGAALQYSTVLGGNGEDRAYGVWASNNGKAYVAGETASSDFPVKSAYQASAQGGADAFVTTINTLVTGNASLVSSSYFGGSANDRAYGLDVDASGNVYLAGYTESTNLPMTNGYQVSVGNGCCSPFLTKWNPTVASLLYSTYLGRGPADWANAVAVDDAGNAYVTGQTGSTSFPVTTGVFQNRLGNGQNFTDAFVTKLNTTAVGAASLVYSTFFGGSNTDFGNAIAIDASGLAYITGKVYWSGMPTTADAVQPTRPGMDDAMVAAFNANASHLMYASYLGGVNNESGAALVLDANRNVYVAGQTSSTSFPVTGAFQISNGGGTDAFITKLLKPVPDPGADLSLLKRVDDPMPVKAQQVTYRLEVKNNGPYDASGISISEALPAGVTFNSANASHGSYNITTGVWTLGSLALNATATLTINATVTGDTGQSITNTASLTASSPADPNPNNNSSSAMLTVEATPVPTLTLTPTPTPTAGPSPTPTATATPLVSNDTFANAMDISSLPFTTSFNLFGATRSSSDPVLSFPCDVSAGVTVWFLYTPAQSQRVEFDVLGSLANTYFDIAVFTGTEGNLTPVDCATNHFDSGLDINLNGGTTYMIMLALSTSAAPTGAIPVVFNAHLVTTPSNDLFANATGVNSLPYSTNQPLYPATTSPTDPTASCYPFEYQHSLWFRYTASADETVRVDLAGSTAELVTAVYTGTEGSLTEVSCNTARFEDTRTNFHTQTGMTYSILVAYPASLTLGGWADINLNMSAAPTPANDEMSGATLIDNLPFSVTEDVYGATANLSDPLLAYLCYSTPKRHPNTVWYQYTPATTQTLQVATEGSNDTPILGVFSGSAGNLALVGCMNVPRLSLVLQGGTTYWFMVSATYGQVDLLPVPASSSTLQISFGAPAAANDLIQDAQEITSIPYALTEDISGATYSASDEDSCQTNVQTHTVWFRYTPTANQKITFNTTGSDYKTGISVFTGTPGNLTLIHCASYGVGLVAQSGTTYYIKVARALNNSYAAPGTMLRFTVQAPAVANDLLQDAAFIPANNLPYTTEQNIFGATTTSTDPGSTPNVGGCSSSILWTRDRSNTVWYQFTPSQTNDYIIDAQSSDYPAVIHIYQTQNGPDLACGFRVASATLQAGVTYGIKFSFSVSKDLYPTDPTMLRFTLKPPVVANDLPRNAQLITTPFDFTQDVALATVTLSEPAFTGCGTAANTVWFRYTAPTDTSIVIDTAGSTYDTSLVLFNEALTVNRGCSSSGQNNSPQAALQLNVSERDTFIIGVANQSGTTLSSPAMLHLTVREAGNNDFVQNARVIPGTALTYSDMQDLNLMSRSPIDPFVTCSPYGPYGYGETMWYTYTPDVMRTVTFKLGAPNDSLLAVFTGAPGALSQIACSTGSGYNQFVAGVGFTAQANTTYTIMVSIDSLSQQALSNTYLMNLKMGAQNVPPSPTPTATFTPMPTATATPQAAPQLISPADGDMTNNTRPLFIWLASNAPTLYEFQIDTVNPPRNALIPVNMTQYIPEAALPAQTYYWRVRLAAGSTGVPGNWSAVRMLRIVSPANAAPVKNASSSATVTVTWNPVTGASQYEIEVSAVANFTTIFHESGAIPGTNTSYTLPPLVDGVWYWRIRAMQPNGTWSLWSVIQSLVVG